MQSGQVTQVADDLSVFAVFTVGKVDACHVHARSQKSLQHLGFAGSGPDGGDDLGLAKNLAPHHGFSLEETDLASNPRTL